MPGMEPVGRMLLIIGVVMIIIGGILIFSGRLGPFKLPGDIYIQRENFVFYFPLMTGIILSIILTIILNLFFRR